MTFHLQIVTPDGSWFDGQAERVSVPTITGPVTILPRHIPYVTALQPGKASVVTEAGRKSAVIGGGLLSVRGEKVTVAADHFCWEEENQRIL